ncbi:hypothetical protein FXO38_26864 [Capsicum annuum]|nr:hypothetical protein FXO38_26864 [Capsicum annuum]
MDPRDIQIFNRDEKTDSQLSFDINENKEGIMDEDNDIELQQILFYSAQFHSGKNSESRSSNAAENSNREAKVLASPYIVDCPYVDCTGKLVDDGKEYLIRTCPNFWRIFCVRCRNAWHCGITFEAYKHMLGQMNFFV